MSYLLDKIEHYNVRSAKLRPDKTALLVIDMQRYFHGIAAPIIKNVVSLIDRCRNNRVPVIYTRHGHRNLDSDGGMLKVWWGDGIMYGSNDWKIMDEVQPLGSEPVIDKMRYSAFYGTKLDDRLRQEEVEDLVICGVMTNCCCETTAREAFMRDYRVFFVADGTATANEELQLATLKNLAYAFAYVVSAGEVVRSM